MQQAEAEFIKMLTLMAGSANMELKPQDFEIYDRMLSKYGYEAVCQVLNDMMLERRPGDRFPSVKDILVKLNPELPEALEATDMANRMIAFMRAAGPDGKWYKLKKFISVEENVKENLGELGWAVFIRRGGYTALREEWAVLLAAQVGFFRTQLRDTINAVIRKAKGGVLNQATPLPAPIRGESKQLESLGGVAQKLLQGRPNADGTKDRRDQGSQYKNLAKILPGSVLLEKEGGVPKK